jgi:PPOX class probable F420-dependent enzyme
MILNAAARRVIEGPHLAHMVTLNPDGSPQVAIVWVGLADGETGEPEVVSGHLMSQRKIENIRRDPRVAISIETDVRNAIGLDEYLVLHGRAYVTEGGAPELLQRLAHTYLGPDVDFPPRPDPPAGFVTHLRVERVGGVGPWS